MCTLAALLRCTGDDNEGGHKPRKTILWFCVSLLHLQLCGQMFGPISTETVRMLPKVFVPFKHWEILITGKGAIWFCGTLRLPLSFLLAHWFSYHLLCSTTPTLLFKMERKGHPLPIFIQQACWGLLKLGCRQIRVLMKAWHQKNRRKNQRNWRQKGLRKIWNACPYGIYRLLIVIWTFQFPKIYDMAPNQFCYNINNPDPTDLNIFYSKARGQKVSLALYLEFINQSKHVYIANEVGMR